MGKEVIIFDEKHTFLFLKDLDINNILISNKTFSGKKKTINTLLVKLVKLVKLNHST